MNIVRLAILFTVVGYVALVVGLACSPVPWVSPVVGGIVLMVLGFALDEPKRPKGKAGP